MQAIVPEYCQNCDEMPSSEPVILSVQEDIDTAMDFERLIAPHSIEVPFRAHMSAPHSPMHSLPAAGVFRRVLRKAAARH